MTHKYFILHDGEIVRTYTRKRKMGDSEIKDKLMEYAHMYNNNYNTLRFVENILTVTPGP